MSGCQWERFSPTNATYSYLFSDLLHFPIFLLVTYFLNDKYITITQVSKIVCFFLLNLVLSLKNYRASNSLLTLILGCF